MKTRITSGTGVTLGVGLGVAEAEAVMLAVGEGVSDEVGVAVSDAVLVVETLEVGLRAGMRAGGCVTVAEEENRRWVRGRLEGGG